MRRTPVIPNPSPDNTLEVLRALVANVGYITAQRQPEIKPLPQGATTADIVSKINEILDRLQAK